MKYASLLEADCCVFDTVKNGMCIGDSRFQIYTTPSAMSDFSVFRRITNNAPGPLQKG